MTFKQQREELANLMQHVLDVSTKLDDANSMVNERLRTIRFILRAELVDYDKLIASMYGEDVDVEEAVCVWPDITPPENFILGEE